MISTSLGRLGVLLSSLVMIGACEFVRTSTPPAVEPSAVPPATSGGGSGGSLLGTWSSLTNAPLTDSAACTAFQWAITQQTATSVAGTFTAICLGSTTVTGTATGELQGSQVKITVSGSANLSGVVCTFTIGGTGTLEDDSLRIPYSGSTCLGPVSGTETLRRPSSGPAPAPPSPPPPAPTPEPAPGPGHCASSDPEAILECIADLYPERLVAHVSLETRQANMAFLRDRIIEAGKCGGLDLGWNLKRGGPDISIDFLAQRLNGEVLGIDIAHDYDNLSLPLRLQWHLGTFPFFLAYPQPDCR